MRNVGGRKKRRNARGQAPHQRTLSNLRRFPAFLVCRFTGSRPAISLRHFPTDFPTRRRRPTRQRSYARSFDPLSFARLSRPRPPHPPMLFLRLTPPSDDGYMRRFTRDRRQSYLPRGAVNETRLRPPSLHARNIAATGIQSWPNY